eukprot:TRINITY_DN54593_c0_g1_i1.p1 TRINITY_DN54593_c0_g1~~TRINITY_DN54593_c0_g1_i1.p1  ORF type:complete len:140 (-),score=19.85 TRINITY_DN54593_c0_g1_i1:153-572(-)
MRNDYQEAMQKLQNDMANTEARLQQLQEQEDNMEEAAQGVQGSIEEKKEQVEQLSQQISQLEVDVKKLKNDDRNLSEQLYRASGSLSIGIGTVVRNEKRLLRGNAEIVERYGQHGSQITVTAGIRRQYGGSSAGGARKH